MLQTGDFAGVVLGDRRCLGSSHRFRTRIPTVVCLCFSLPSWLSSSSLPLVDVQNLQMTAFGWLDGFIAGIRCAMSISLIYISLTPICLKSCRQRFAVCSEDSRSATAIQWFWNWTDSCIFQMNQSISKVGRRHQRLSLTWVSFSLSLRMHISWMPGTHRTVQIQIQLIWPYSLAMNHCHSRSSITFFGSVINFHT